MAARPSTDVQSRITKPGDYRFAIQHAGLTRTYRVHVPPRYTPTEPTPLLVALHGGGIERVGDDGFDSLARASDFQNFIAVYPDAYVGSNKKASWNAGNCCGEARDRKINDVGFIEQVVNNVFSQASIDRQRIYAAGMSDGGMMAYRLACELPFVFRAIASVGGTDNTVNCRPGHEVSVLHLHAKNDPRVPFNGSAAAEAADNGKLPPPGLRAGDRQEVGAGGRLHGHPASRAGAGRRVLRGLHLLPPPDRGAHVRDGHGRPFLARREGAGRRAFALARDRGHRDDVELLHRALTNRGARVATC